jgi:hypothetical protein
VSDRAASHAARLRSGQETGVGTGPKSLEGGMDSFWGVAVRGNVIEKAVGNRKVMLAGVRLVG